MLRGVIRWGETSYITSQNDLVEWEDSKGGQPAYRGVIAAGPFSAKSALRIAYGARPAP